MPGNPCTLPRSLESYARQPVRFRKPFLRAMPGQTCTLSPKSLLEVMPNKSVCFHTQIHLAVMPGNLHTLSHSLGSYAEKSMYASKLIWKLCQKIHVRFYTHVKVMPGNPCTLPY